ncbi:MAG: pirin family protein [Synechococcaceae cyanobacterium]|nr:pirin family protein [Synechococcaceae cyanobacterium]
MLSSPADPAGAAGQDGLRLRPAAERFHSRSSWLDSRHSFSFAGHDDPLWRGFGPLRVINEDWIAAGQGFGPHPHRDIEIISVLLAGALSHRDSLGHSAVIQAGEVQCMSAGTGIVHSEINAAEQPCRLLQIWIEPRAAGLPPTYRQRAFPAREGWTPLIDPDGRDAALAIERPVRLWRGRAAAASQLPLPPLAGPLGWIQLIEGRVSLEFKTGDHNSDPSLRAGDGLGFPAGAIRALDSGDDGTDLLLFELG